MPLRAPFWKKLNFFRSDVQIILQEHLQKLVTVDVADHTAGVFVVCDIAGVFGENVSHDLANGIVALFFKGAVDLGEDLLHLTLVVGGYSELHRVSAEHNTFSLLTDGNSTHI